jgi:hypothetical protein
LVYGFEQLIIALTSSPENKQLKAFTIEAFLGCRLRSGFLLRFLAQGTAEGQKARRVHLKIGGSLQIFNKLHII